MNRWLVIVLLFLVASSCAREIRPNDRRVYLDQVLRACPGDGLVTDTDGSARAKTVHVRDMSAGFGPWHRVCDLDSGNPRIWTRDKQPVLAKKRLLQFRRDGPQSGNAGAFVGLALASVAVASVAMISGLLQLWYVVVR